MNRLDQRFAELKARGEKALVLFVTAGDLLLDDLPELLSALEEGGADVVEVGIPFSDPFGEGPTIQASSQRALDAGATPARIFAAMARANVGLPLVTMGYTNPVMRMGWGEYAKSSRAAGSCGTIVSDLVPDEAGPWLEACADNDLHPIFLAAPTSTDERIRQVASLSSGFVYAVSRTGVTGAENQAPPEVQGLVRRIKQLTETPVCVGFGISRPADVRMVCEVADGAVVGSALVDRLHRTWDEGKGRAEIVAFVRELKSATRA